MKFSARFLLLLLPVTLLLFPLVAGAQDALKTEVKEPVNAEINGKAKPVEAKIRDLGGSVEAYLAKAGEWIDAASGAKYVEKDALSTDKKSFALLEFHDGNFLKMKENTELSIRKLYKRVDTGEETTEIDLTKGEILNRVRQLPTEGSIYTIHTPTATSSVRGTRFGVRVYEKDGAWITVVQVMDGVVEVTDKVGKILKITEDEQTEISELGVPDNAEKMDRRSRRNLQRGMQPLDNASSTLTGEETGGGGVSTENLGDAANDLENKADETLDGIETVTDEAPSTDSDDDDDSQLF